MRPASSALNQLFPSPNPNLILCIQNRSQPIAIDRYTFIIGYTPFWYCFSTAWYTGTWQVRGRKGKRMFYSPRAVSCHSTKVGSRTMPSENDVTPIYNSMQIRCFNVETTILMRGAHSLQETEIRHSRVFFARFLLNLNRLTYVAVRASGRFIFMPSRVGRTGAR